ncbi:MAG: OPT/YSL family transporter [Candidatus Bathyarchaeia archaeon]
MEESIQRPSTNGQKVELKEGLTWRSILALIFASVFILPISIYMNYVAGVGIGGSAVYIVTLLFTELSNMFGARLSKQEVFIIFMVVGTAAIIDPFSNYVYRGYFLTSPLGRLFIDPLTKSPLPDIMPTWWAPSATSSVWISRTFISPEWIFPITLNLIHGFAFAFSQQIAMAFICAHLYIEEEKLAFPLAPISSEMIIALTEREEEKLRVFMLSAFVGMVYGAILYVGPIVLPFMPRMIPVPWFDFTAGTYGIERIFPGAIFGLASDLIPYLTGFLLPLNIAVYMVIGSLSIWVFGNWITRTVFSSYFPSWTEEWVQGMTMSLVYQRSFIRVWIAPFIGFGLAVATLTIAKHHRAIINALRSLVKISSSPEIFQKRGILPFKIILIFFLIGTLGSVVLVYFLVPDFPIWISLVMAFLIGPVYALISARSVGETGFGITIPYIWEGTILLSGYGGIGPWLISPIFEGGAPANFTQTIKIAYLTETKPISFFKAYLISIVVSSILSFLFVSFFWKLAPIPSSAYPWTMVQWPVNVLTSGTWWTKKITFQTDSIITSFIIIIIIGVLGETLARYTSMPFSLVALVAGTGQLPYIAVPIFIGALIGKYIIQRIIGKEKWNNYRYILFAGVAAGEGLSIAISVAAVMLTKTAWTGIF